jgi:hypothetical protein
MRRRRAWAFRGLAFIGLGLLVSACGDDAGAGAGGGGGAAGGLHTSTIHPDAPPLPGESACTVTETTGIPVVGFSHVDLCTKVRYENPPSGGDHWPLWATYKEWDTPVPREMYVHNMEHGAVVFTYRCDGCEGVKGALRAASERSDPLCVASGPGPEARVLITPDPKLDTPIAISAWGATYTATCIHLPSMEDFVDRVYGNGREAVCADGGDPPACPLED